MEFILPNSSENRLTVKKTLRAQAIFTILALACLCNFQPRIMIRNIKIPGFFRKTLPELQAILTPIPLSAMPAMLVLAAGLLSGCNLNVQDQSSVAPVHARRQLTNDGWPKTDVAWSPDGTRLAYSSVQTKSSVMAVSIDGRSQEKGSINDDVQLQNFAVSPDGQRVVYRSGRKGHLWLVDLRDNSETLLAMDHRNALDPAWSPGGNRIAFSSPNSENERSAIWLVEAEANATPVLVSPSEGEFSLINPTWSPDEAALVCEVNSKMIGIIEVATRSLFIIASDTTDSTSYSSPAWAPNSNTIAYSVSRNGVQSIEIMPLTGKPKTVTPQFRSAQNPAWSANGSRLAFNSRSAVWVISIDGTDPQQTDLVGQKPIWWPTSNSLIQLQKKRTSKINVVTADGVPLASLVNPSENGSDVMPTWQADGSAFVFVRRNNDPDSSQIRQLALDSETESLLLDQSTVPDEISFFGSIANPVISPIDNSIIFDDGRDIFLLMPQGQPPVNLSEGIAQSMRQPAWSYDGKQMVCASDGYLILYGVQSNGFVEKKSIPGAFRNPVWSNPNPIFGSRIAVESGSGIFVIHPERGQPEFVLWGRYPAWSPDGAQLAFMQQNEIYVEDILVRGDE